MSNEKIKNFGILAFIAGIAIAIIPLPVWLLDVLIATNILFSLMLVFVVLCIPRVANLSPSKILVSRLPKMMLVSSELSFASNIATIMANLNLWFNLSSGAKFDRPIIRTFSTFLVGNGETENLPISFVIFIIITIIQAAILIKSTPHIASLASSFIAENAKHTKKDVEAGLISDGITEEEAEKRKMEIQDEVEFYSSMYDAVDFSSGIVKLGLFYTVINLVGSIILDMILYGESFYKAVHTYAGFAIGYGLIAQLPPLLISLAASLIVTRLIKNSILDGNKNDYIKRQFAQNSKIYFAGGITMIIIGLLPSLPWYILIPLGLAFLYIGSQLKYKIVKPHHAIGSFEEIEEKNHQLKDKKWLKTRQLDANHTEQIAIDMTGPAYNSHGELNEYIEILNKGEAEKNEIILKKLTAKWNDIFERKDFFEGITFKFKTYDWYEKIGNLPDGRLRKTAGAPTCEWNHIASAIKSKYLEITYSGLEYTTKDNKVISIGIKKEAFGAVIKFSFISEEATIKMHIYITPHGTPALPDLREPDIIDAQINVKLPKNKADAKRITMDDIFAKLGIEKFWEKATNFEQEFLITYGEAYNKNLEEQFNKQKNDSKEKVQADMEKLNKVLSELDSI